MREPRWEFVALPAAFILLAIVLWLSAPDSASTLSDATETPVSTEVAGTPSATGVPIEPQLSGAVLDVEIEGAEVLEPPVLPVQMHVHFLNDGDVAARPLVAWAILDHEGLVIDQGRLADTVASPGMVADITIPWDHAGQPIGDYTARLTTTLGETLVDERDAGFQLLPEGTLTPKGELVEVRFEGAIAPSAAGEIVGVFHNTGNFDVAATLSVEIYRDTEIIAVVTSDPQPSANGENTLIRATFQFPDTGHYGMAGKVLYADKETSVQEAQFDVTAPDADPTAPDVTATAEPTPTVTPETPTPTPTEEPAPTQTPVAEGPDPTSTPIQTVEPAPTPTTQPTEVATQASTPSPTPPALEPAPTQPPDETATPTPTATPTSTPELPQPTPSELPELVQEDPAPTAPTPSPSTPATFIELPSEPPAPVEIPVDTPQPTATAQPSAPQTAIPHASSTTGPAATPVPTVIATGPSATPVPAAPIAPADPPTPLEIVSTWQLPDMQPGVDAIQYGTRMDPGQHDDDILQPGIQVAPNLGDIPGERQIEFWTIVEAPNGAGGIASVVFNLYGPDGSLRQHIAASLANCQALEGPHATSSPLGAAVDTGQLTVAAGESAATCTSTGRAVYRAIAELSIADPPGAYQVKTVVRGSNAETRTAWQEFEVLAMMGLRVNVDVVDFGRIRPGGWQQANTTYNVQNTGNRAGHVAITFGAMVGAESGVKIAGYGAELATDRITSIAPNATVCFSASLQPGEYRELRLLVHPGEIPADRYSGQLAFNLRASCAP